ncbi:MAG: METTL5 family protein [Halobacteriales archaeon]|nr:METTL5 family protein [Halobacteriales archaeon]
MLKEVEMELQRLEGFESPEARLEQYETPAPLASRLLHLAWSRGDLDGWVLDLGCGTGVLGIGAALYGARVVGVDVDRNALEAARRNAESANVAERTDWVHGEVNTLPVRRVDTVVMNPPFGAQKRGADRPFLRAAEEVADVVYTVHNEGSRDFVESFVDGELTDAFETTVGLKHRFEFHDEEERENVVEVYRIET